MDEVEADLMENGFFSENFKKKGRSETDLQFFRVSAYLGSSSSSSSLPSLLFTLGVQGSR